MTEKQYEEALFALGCKNVTSKTQKKNGTMAFRLPDGKNMVTCLLYTSDAADE